MAEAAMSPAKAFETGRQYQANGDLSKLYGIARRDGFDYNLAHIPASFDVPSKEAFNKAYMNALYKVGYDLARNGYQWQKKPPAYLAPSQR